MSKITKRVLIGTVIVLQLASLGVIGYLAVYKWAWKYEAVKFAQYNGSDDATTDYRRGRKRILEVKAYEDGAPDYTGRSYQPYEKESAKRTDGPYEVWWVMIPDKFYADTAAAYVKAYNSAMRHRVENPELYTPAGDHIPGRLPKASPKHVPPGTI